MKIILLVLLTFLGPVLGAPPDPAPQASPVPAPATEAINQFGLDLHRSFTGKYPASNLCLSPYSIDVCLAMAFAGANGKTRDEMAAVLHYPPGDAIHTALTKLGADFTKRKTNTDQGSVVFLSANRLLGKDGYPYRQSFLDLLQKSYGAPFQPVDFTKPTEAARQVNDWVSQQTGGWIKDLVPESYFTSDLRLLIINAVYFKATWEVKFDAGDTKLEPFKVGGTTAQNVPMMHTRQFLGCGKGDGYTALSLPYSGGNLQFLALVPDDPAGLPALEKRITATQLTRCAKLKSVDVALSLPRFKFTSASLPLRDHLQLLGMNSAFDFPAGSADFTGIAPRQGIKYLGLSQVIHKTYIALDETGTEAAAATAGVIAGLDTPGNTPLPYVVKVDRPFLFAIQHHETGTCLFLGRVMDPR